MAVVIYERKDDFMMRLNSNELDKLTIQDIFPCMDNDEYKKLFLRFWHAEECESDEFIISELLQIYINTKDDNLKVRILELLKYAKF